LLTDSGLVPVTGQQWVEVRHLTDTEAQLLSRAPGEAFLWSRCVTRTADGDLVENVESLLDPAHFRLHFQFSAQDS
jgi:GntR family transcriptional regulator